MADYSSMSDAQLMALVQPQQSAAPDYSQMSDADLMKAVQPKSSGVMDFLKSIPRGMVTGLASTSAIQEPGSPVPIADELLTTAPEKVKALETLTGPMHQPEGR